MNGNLVEVSDSSSGAVVDSYQVGYDGLNRVAQVVELASGVVANTTSFTYNQVGAPAMDRLLLRTAMLGCNMQRIGMPWRVGLAAATAVLLLGSGCASPETRAGRDLAGTVKIDGYRKLSEKHRGETTLLYFVGPAGVDLHQAVTARNWSPEPPPPGLPEVGAFEWVITSSADTEDHICHLAVSTLRPGFEDVAIHLDDEQKRDLVAGRLTYVKVASVCAEAP